MSNKGNRPHYPFFGIKPREIGESEAKSTIDKSQQRGIKPRTVGEGVARGRALCFLYQELIHLVQLLIHFFLDENLVD